MQRHGAVEQHADSDNDTDTGDPWYYFCFNEKWQAIPTFRGSDANAKERTIYHAAGLDGAGSSSYIDDVVFKDWDKNSGWTNAADSTKEVRRYYLHNWRHDVVAILSSAGKLIQNVKYLGAPTWWLSTGPAQRDHWLTIHWDGCVALRWANASMYPPHGASKAWPSSQCP